MTRVVRRLRMGSLAVINDIGRRSLSHVGKGTWMSLVVLIYGRYAKSWNSE